MGISAIPLVLLIAYVPGALLFRLPVADRPGRAGLPAEERVFWSVVLSVAVSSVVVLALAALGSYRFDRLLAANAAVSLVALAAAGRRIGYSGAAPRPTWTALVPVALIGLASWTIFAVPPAEYVMGGKDPGVYMNEGIQIAQRNGLAVVDSTAAAVPPAFRDLFFPERADANYYSNRFMGFFLMDPGEGIVLSQFTHLYPAWIAMAYGVNGLSGARQVLALWALLGVAAVYFLGTRVAGRAAGAAAAGLLAVHVLQVWYARYPNAEMVMQALALAGILAWVRAQVDGDRFFAPVAAALVALTVFAHLTGVFLIGAMAAAAVLGRFAGQPVRVALAVPFVIGGAIGIAYLFTFLSPYLAEPFRFLRSFTPLQRTLGVLLVAGGAGLWLLAHHPPTRERVKTTAPAALVAVLWLGALYAYFFRASGGTLAPHDADAVRTFAHFYVTPLGLFAALAGFTLLARRAYWASAPFLVPLAVFCLFFFYKIRIIPEHFWAGRRLVALILPGVLLLIGAAAFTSTAPDAPSTGRRTGRLVRSVVGAVLVLVLGYQYLNATRPILRHVEYAGLIPHLEKLAGTFGDDDLILVEARQSSDIHVLALPLAYVYARNVLVLSRAAPDKLVFRGFLEWAADRYDRVFFVGGGGTELLSRTMRIESIGGERFQVPEYESLWHEYPDRVTFKEFEFGIYELVPQPMPAGDFDLDVGVTDDLHVRRFYAKEQRPSGATFRWSRDVSYVSLVGLPTGCRRVTLWLGSGGRPPAAPPPEVGVSVDGVPLGTVTTGSDIAPYTFDIPAPLAEAMGRSEEAAQLRLDSRTWNPRQLLDAPDDRDLGVMLDRVLVECGSSS